MASTVQVPPPPRQRRSYAGPIVLIVMGVLLLLANMGKLPWESLAQWFAHYWPLLIILWGVVKLIEYYQAQREGTRPRGIGAGGVFLLIVLIVFGLAASQATRLNLGAIRDNMDLGDNDFPLFGHSYSFDDHVEQAFPAGAGLHVVNDRGAVNLTVSEDDQIRVSVHKRINAENQGDADKWNASTKPQITVSDHMVSVNANTQGAGDHWIIADMDIAVPRKASVVIANRRGDVRVTGRDGDADVSNQRGDISAEDVKGKVSLNLDRSTARVSQVEGDVSVQGHGDDISVQDVKGAARISGEFDSIKLEKISNGVSFKSARTDMEFTRLDGDLDMASGDLRANDIVGPFRLLTRSKDVQLSGVSGDVRLQDENGSVEVHMKKMGSMQVDNRRGDIQIYVPDAAGFHLDARARGGEVETDFQGLQSENNNDLATASGTIGGGGPRVIINNEHGTIEIRKGSAVAEVPAPPKMPKGPKVPAAGPKATEN
jgi:DUF4097 and DUF4098 domain-containing protein YvlB